MSLGGDWHEPACELSGICGLKVMGKVKLELEFGWNCAKKILSLKKKMSRLMSSRLHPCWIAGAVVEAQMPRLPPPLVGGVHAWNPSLRCLGESRKEARATSAGSSRWEGAVALLRVAELVALTEGAPSHPTEETHFGRCYPPSCPVGHSPKFTSTSESNQ